MHSLSTAPRPTAALRPTLLLALALMLAASLARLAPPPPLQQIAAPAGVPLSFVPNRGQAEPDVLMEARALGGWVAFLANEVALALPSPDGDAPLSLRLQFLGASADPAIAGVEPLPGVVNSYLGADPSRWRGGIPTYGALIYRGLYPGIDLRYDGAGGALKGTYTVAPGADPSGIGWRYAGAAGLLIEPESGDLRVTLPGGGVLTEEAPVAWQVSGGQNVPVASRFVVEGETVRFALGAYDPALPLVIDPTLVYSTYFGGGSSDVITSAAADAQGNLYLTGSTGSAGLPGATGSPRGGGDTFVTKLNPGGTAALYTTYIGGSDSDDSSDIAVDAASNVWISGATGSVDFPALRAVQPTPPTTYYSNAFVVRLSADGRPLISSYLGDKRGGIANAVAVDRQGDAYLAGAFGDAIVIKVAAQTPSITYQHRVEGLFRRAEARDVAVDKDGLVYATGGTDEEEWPTANAIQASCARYSEAECSRDAFILKLDPATNTRLFSSYFGGSAANGGSGEDIGLGIAVDASGAIYLAGETYADDLPIAAAFQPARQGPENFAEGFVSKLVPQGSGYALAYSSYLGGADWDVASSIALDGARNVYLTGLTRSQDFPLQGPLQPVLGDGVCGVGGSERRCYDAFVAQVAPDGRLAFSTYWGGPIDDIGNAVAVDGEGNIYVVGQTRSLTFPTSRGALQAEKGLLEDGFVLKLRGGATAPPPPPPGEHRVYLPLVQR